MCSHFSCSKGVHCVKGESKAQESCETKGKLCERTVLPPFSSLSKQAGRRSVMSREKKVIFVLLSPQTLDRGGGEKGKETENKLNVFLLLVLL